MTGLKSQRKGRANELQITRDFKAAGFECRTHGQYEALDATVVIDGEPWPVEAKKEAKCAAKAYAAFEAGAKVFIQQADRKPRLVTILWEDFLVLADNTAVGLVNLEITEKGLEAIEWLENKAKEASGQ
jgi:hypothetical protein